MIRRYVVAGFAVLLAASGAAQTRAPHDALLARFAIELAAERDVAPIALDADGSGLHGVAYDRFTQIQLAARVATRKGAPLDPLKPPASLLVKQLIVVAVPLVCGTRTVRPADVDIDNRGRPVLKWLPATGATIQTLLPGATVPSGAIAVQFADASFEAGEIVRISYDSPVCSGASKVASLPVSVTAARALERPSIEVKPGERAPAGPVTLNITGVVDLDGRLRYATAPEAATPVGAMALASAVRMRFEPARINGSPTPWTSGIILTFGASEAPTTPSELSTPDVPSLTEATSKCPVSADETYGISGLNAIRIGGGVDASARELKYLSALRGPAGQGLQYRAAGPVMLAGRGQTILDAYDVRHAGLARAMRVYFDPSQESTLSAPKGFACAAPLVVK
jgi:hypothetical protein